MNPLVREAVEITQDLGDVIFIGAVAIMLHTKTGRPSSDLDIALTTELLDTTLENKGYLRFQEKRDSWQTPRHFKIDIYRKDVSKIPIKLVIETSVRVKVDSSSVRVAGLETLIVAKMRAGRPQDGEDLRLLARKKFNEINWKVIESMASSEGEFGNIKTTMNFYRNS